MVVHRRRRAVQDGAREGAPAPPGIQGQARARRGRERSERARAPRAPSRRPAGRAPARSSGRTPSPTPGPSCASRERRSSASVGFFPERYGDGLIKLAFDILSHRPAPPAALHPPPAHHDRERRPLLPERRVARRDRAGEPADRDSTRSRTCRHERETHSGTRALRRTAAAAGRGTGRCAERRCGWWALRTEYKENPLGHRRPEARG